MKVPSGSHSVISLDSFKSVLTMKFTFGNYCEIGRIRRKTVFIYQLATKKGVKEMFVMSLSSAPAAIFEASCRDLPSRNHKTLCSRRMVGDTSPTRIRITPPWGENPAKGGDEWRFGAVPFPLFGGRWIIGEQSRRHGNKGLAAPAGMPYRQLHRTTEH